MIMVEKCRIRITPAAFIVSFSKTVFALYFTLFPERLTLSISINFSEETPMEPPGLLPRLTQLSAKTGKPDAGKSNKQNMKPAPILIALS